MNAENEGPDQPVHTTDLSTAHLAYRMLKNNKRDKCILAVSGEHGHYLMWTVKV